MLCLWLSYFSRNRRARLRLLIYEHFTPNSLFKLRQCKNTFRKKERKKKKNKKAKNSKKDINVKFIQHLIAGRGLIDIFSNILQFVTR